VIVYFAEEATRRRVHIQDRNTTQKTMICTCLYHVL